MNQYYRTQSSNYFSIGKKQQKQKNDFIQIRTITYKKKERGRTTDPDSKNRTDGFDKESLKTTLQWIRKPLKRKLGEKGGEGSLTTYYSNRRTQTSIRRNRMPSLKNLKEKDMHRKTVGESFYNPKIAADKETSHQGRIQSSELIHQRMPFYLNFVEDKVLDRIPHLRKYKKMKVPSTRAKFRKRWTKDIPHEDEIKARYAMRMPVRVSDMENPASSIHLLEKPWPGIRKVKDMCYSFKDDSKNLKLAVTDARYGLNEFAKKHDKELNNIRNFFREELRHFYGLMRMDSLNHQNNKIKLHKQVQKLKRSETELIQNIEAENMRIYDLEDELFADQVFKLETEDKDLKDVHEGILRKEHENLPQWKPIVKLQEGFIPGEGFDEEGTSVEY